MCPSWCIGKLLIGKLGKISYNPFIKEDVYSKLSFLNINLMIDDDVFVNDNGDHDHDDDYDNDDFDD